MTAIYEPNSIALNDYMDKAARSECRVCDSKQLGVQKYIFKPEQCGKGHRAYETGKPVVRLYRIKKSKWDDLLVAVFQAIRTKKAP